MVYYTTFQRRITWYHFQIPVSVALFEYLMYAWPYVLPPLHGVWPSSHTVWLTFEDIKWERDRISKIRARPPVRNDLLFNSLSEHERLGANPGAASGFPKCTPLQPRRPCIAFLPFWFSGLGPRSIRPARLVPSKLIVPIIAQAIN